jgi:hypothetical protein
MLRSYYVVFLLANKNWTVIKLSNLFKCEKLTECKWYFS